MTALPGLGVPAERGKATVNCIASACVRAAVQAGAMQSCSGKSQGEHYRITLLLRELYGLPARSNAFLDFAITRDFDGTPRLVVGEHQWDHLLTRDAAAEFERRAAVEVTA